MIKVVKKEIDVEESLRKRLTIICDFCNTSPTIIKGSIRKIEKTNISYIEPHRVIIKDKLFLDSVSKTNKEYKKVQELSVTLNNVDTEIKENHQKIKTLTENNDALSLRVETLTKNIKNKDKEIKELKEENHSLKNTLEFWKDKFLRVISLIKNKLFVKEKYFDVSKDLYTKEIIKDDTFEDMKEIYIFSKEHDDRQKDKDDYGIEI